jgi:hypothetical protein
MNLLFEYVPVILESMPCKSWPKFEKKTECEKSGRVLTFSETFTISSCQFLWRVALFFKIEMDNPSLNFTWSKTKCISIERCQIYGMSVLYASRGHWTKPQNRDWFQWPKVCNWFTRTHHHWHHSVAKKHHFFHAKFEVRFVIYFMRKSMSNEKRHFSWEDGPSFFRPVAKAEF